MPGGPGRPRPASSMCRWPTGSGSPPTAGPVADVYVGQVREIETQGLGRHGDASPGEVHAATAQRAREDRADQPARHAAPRTGHATQPIAGAVAGRRHRRAEELLDLPHHRADAGQSRDELHGGGLPNLEVIPNEVYGIVHGRAEPDPGTPRRARHVRRPARRATRRCHPRDRVHRPAARDVAAAHRETLLDRAPDRFPPLVKHLADSRGLVIEAVDVTGRFSEAPTRTADSTG